MQLSARQLNLPSHLTPRPRHVQQPVRVRISFTAVVVDGEVDIPNVDQTRTEPDEDRGVQDGHTCFLRVEINPMRLVMHDKVKSTCTCTYSRGDKIVPQVCRSMGAPCRELSPRTSVMYSILLKHKQHNGERCKPFGYTSKVQGTRCTTIN